MPRNTKEDVKATKKIVLPEGRMINSSLFEKDQYDEKSTPSYKIEIAFEKGPDFDSVFEELLAYADAEWGPFAKDDKRGELNVDGGKLISGVLDGDDLAAKREAKGKQGDAYKNKWVIRSNTIFNLRGENAPGGVQVFAEDLSPITILNSEQVYPGCFVQAAVTIDGYEDDRSGQHAMKFYLSAVQKVADGEKLVSTADHSSLFQARKPAAAGAAGAAANEGGRRRRAG